MASELEWAWAAGVFEGEGSIYVPPPSQGRGLRLSVAQSSADDEPPPLLVRFHAIVGVGEVRRHVPNAVSRKPRWFWRVQRREHSLEVLEHLRPFLTVDARAAIDVHLDTRAST